MAETAAGRSPSRDEAQHHVTVHHCQNSSILEARLPAQHAHTLPRRVSGDLATVAGTAWPCSRGHLWRCVCRKGPMEWECDLRPRGHHVAVRQVDQASPRTSAPHRFSTRRNNWMVRKEMNAQRFHVSGSGHPTRVTPEQAVALWSDRLQPQPLHEVLDGCDHLCFGRILSAACGKQGRSSGRGAPKMRKQLGQVISSTARHLPHSVADASPPPPHDLFTPDAFTSVLDTVQPQRHDLPCPGRSADGLSWPLPPPPSEHEE